MAIVAYTGIRPARYYGLRMTAEEFLALPEDGNRYELIDGVVCMSPSPSLPHQEIVLEIAGQLRDFLRVHPLGRVVPDVDIQVAPGLVYRPDLIYLCNEKAARCGARVTVIPDVVVEVVSPDSHSFDHQTKKGDYERAGVSEYWLIDPDRREFTFYRLAVGRFASVAPGERTFVSQIIPGFELDLDSARRLFPQAKPGQQ